MTFLEFKNQMFPLACFNIHQIYAWQADFDRNNLTRWIKAGYIVRLRQGYFAFPEYRRKPDYHMYFANRIYRPSYISLHTALAFYGMIPEAVVQVTSVTTLKTAYFDNAFAQYSYKTVKESMMFGYDLMPMEGDRVIQFATPEKAILDLLYLYPFYDSEREMEELRFDDYFMQEELDKDLLINYCARTKNKALDKRLKLLFKAYAL
ncbi:MAG: hypothetical protein LBI58_04245 [Tannerellaceae bacterium]|jgi:predicted transcriptional regulator of viral defense system|nr:hypothetical protein [Tannerellaceae bacterium]